MEKLSVTSSHSSGESYPEWTVTKCKWHGFVLSSVLVRRSLHSAANEYGTDEDQPSGSWTYLMLSAAQVPMLSIMNPVLGAPVATGVSSTCAQQARDEDLTECHLEIHAALRSDTSGSVTLGRLTAIPIANTLSYLRDRMCSSTSTMPFGAVRPAHIT